MVTTRLASMEKITLGLIAGHEQTISRRALDLATDRKVALTVRIAIDVGSIEAAREPEKTTQLTRREASAALQRFHDLNATECQPELIYQEDDPEKFFSCSDGGRTLLMLPASGWFHHGVEVDRPLTSWEPDGLLRLPGIHQGPVLFASRWQQDNKGPVVLYDCGEKHLPALLGWALRAQLWSENEICYVGKDPERFSEVLVDNQQSFDAVFRPGRQAMLPGDCPQPSACILGRTPRPLRTDWFGTHWHSQIRAGFGGEVLLMEGH